MHRVFNRRQIVTLMTGAAAVALPWGDSHAQTPVPNGWPSKPVRLIVPSGAGSQTDLFARYVGDSLGRTFGQPFIVENKPGASGSIGAMAALSAPADGYTLLFTAASFTIVPAALKTPKSYDLLRDLSPIVQIGVGGLFLAVAPSMPVKSAQELFELARKQPGKYAYGTTGIGSTGHLIMAALLQQRGGAMNHAAYKSSADVLRDLMGGTLEVGWIDTTSSIGAIHDGKVRALAHGSTYRVPLTPDIPTLNEVGIPWSLNGWLGLFARAGTPASIIRAVNAEVNKVLQSDEGKARLTAMNVANPPPTTPEEFAQMIRHDLPQWRKIALDNNITPQS